MPVFERTVAFFAAAGIEGAQALELAGSLGISRGEAELIVALQRAEKPVP